MGVFREEALARKAESLHGTISLAVPMSWQVIAASIGAMVAVAIGFLLSASYSRTEIASGTVLPADGILRIVPPRPGRVEAVEVVEGQSVRRGQLLASIRSEESDGAGGGTQSSILAAIGRQQRSLADQERLTRIAAASEQAGYEAQIAGLRQEVRSMEAQVAVQRKLVDMAQADLRQAESIAERGFISRRDIAAREETLLSRQQALAALQQNQAAKASSLRQAAQARGQAQAKSSGVQAALVTSRAQMDREGAVARGDRGYALVAPADGRIAALDIHVGDALSGQDAAMAIVPSGGRLVARLFVSDKAVGFVRIGQSVRLAMDAYPNERFGTVDAQIAELSAAPVMRAGRDGGTSPFYIATAAMRRPSVRAYGREQPLLPGMAFTARIVVEHRSLLQWIFDPVIAAARS